ncbi:hypothetical protein [Methylobacterium sp. WCS2018Hpa-22]|uniref:hypothetical protein n=1 Tax=Methylobacterium sp. WCS2018Hpa-22 TaxID=3073633 RepID=UPI00288AB9BE|nr:hypothetical protein [Methylobacterium sp. WCS2018Hpa-22]
MRKFDATYRISEADDVLVKENVIHEDLDRRLDDVEKLADDFREGNRIDVEALIARYNLTVADLAAAVKDVLDQVEKGFPAAMVVESSSLQFLTPARRASIVSEILGGADDNADTLAKVFAVADSRVTAGELAESVSELSRDIAARISDLKGGAPASRDTLMELSTAIDGVANDLAAAVAALKGGAPANRDTLKEVSDAIDAVAASVATVNANVSAITAGSTAARDTLKEVSDALDALSATVSALTAGAAASRDTFAEVGTALDTQNTAINNRLRFDAAQTLTAAQKDQAVANAGLNDRFVRMDGANSAQFGSRNRFVNGAFEVWQRGTSIPAANNNNRYVCDMVQCVMNGAGATMQYDRIVDSDGKTKLRAQTSGVPTDATLNVLKFYCEGGSTFAGKRVAISFNMRKFGSGGNFPMPNPVALRQNFGTGGTPSPQVVCPIVSFPADQTFTANDTRFTYIFDVPSLTDKVFGTNGDDHLNWNVYLPLNVAFKVMISEMQIEEIGTVGAAIPSPFERRTPADYLMMCQRYYEKSYNVDDAPGAATNAGSLQQQAQAAAAGLALGSVRFASGKRATPAVTLYNPVTGTTSTPVRNGTANTNVAGTVQNIGTGGFTVSSPASVAAGDTVQTHWIADASY